uniref:Uncharacterized protein n=1 Tax=Branchiostoma floridae TaxID=7739 RepID=C3ZD46_BRAFL|eukprot:XP_002593546.1 hypothetical protein BRAFLDRAFT_88519 [Branchiostoma floridae]
MMRSPNYSKLTGSERENLYWSLMDKATEKALNEPKLSIPRTAWKSWKPERGNAGAVNRLRRTASPTPATRPPKLLVGQADPYAQYSGRPASPVFSADENGRRSPVPKLFFATNPDPSKRRAALNVPVYSERNKPLEAYVDILAPEGVDKEELYDALKDCAETKVKQMMGRHPPPVQVTVAVQSPEGEGRRKHQPKPIVHDRVEQFSSMQPRAGNAYSPIHWVRSASGVQYPSYTHSSVAGAFAPGVRKTPQIGQTPWSVRPTDIYLIGGKPVEITEQIVNQVNRQRFKYCNSPWKDDPSHMYCRHTTPATYHPTGPPHASAASAAAATRAGGSGRRFVTRAPSVLSRGSYLSPETVPDKHYDPVIGGGLRRPREMVNPELREKALLEHPPHKEEGMSRTYAKYTLGAQEVSPAPQYLYESDEL